MAAAAVLSLVVVMVGLLLGVVTLNITLLP